jgi:hypothetical protein
MARPIRPLFGSLKRWLALALLGGTLAVAASVLNCAEVQQDWPLGDSGNSDGGDNRTDGGGPWRCFTGTATNESQLLNHCTESEPINRPSNIPPTTWDGKSPLPGTQ